MAGVGGFIWFSVLTVGGGLGIGLVLCAVWAAYLLILTISHWVAALPYGRVVGTFVLINVLFLFATVVTVGVGSTRIRRLDQSITPLSYSPAAHEVYQLVMPRLIRSGDEAVGPLIADCERAIETVNRPENDLLVLSRASFCLAKIGGSQAEQYLGKLVRERVDFSRGCVYSQWAHHVCFAYAECGGERAASDLIALYDRSEQGRWIESRYAVLVALIKTGSKDGVLFALDHIDELLKLDEDDVFDYDCVAEVIDGLIDCRDEIELQRLPVYGRNLFGGLDRVAVESIRQDAPAELVKKLPPRREARWRSDVLSRWELKRADTLRRWTEHFSAGQ